MALVPVAIYSGLRDSISIADLLRRKSRCPICGYKGATTIVPSWIDRERGVQEFPVPRK